MAKHAGDLSAQVPSAEFTDFLRAMCEAGDVKPAKLHFFIARRGYFVREESVRRWIQDLAQPSAKALPALLGALQDAAPDLDVWGEFDNWLHGRPFLQASRGGEAKGKDRNKGSFRSTPRRSGGRQGPISGRRSAHLSVVQGS